MAGDNVTETSQYIDFNKDINALAEKAIEAFNLSYKKTAHSNLHDPLTRWCDFILRYIPSTKRKIYKSDRFPVNISVEAQIGLQRIEDLFTNGGNVNPYQSKTLTLNNDTSDKKQKKRTDCLWADWGIHHLHLPCNPASPEGEYSDRSDWLLFLKIYPNAVLFIDVKHHDKDIEPELFSQQDLPRTFIRNWPKEAEKYQIRGVDRLAISQQITDSDIRMLRNAGINVPIIDNEKTFYSMGMGITTAVTSMRVTSYRDDICKYAREIEQHTLNDEGQIMKELKADRIDKPLFHINICPDGNLAIYEAKSEKAWKLARKNPTVPNDLYCLFNNSLMPEWAGLIVANHCHNN